MTVLDHTQDLTGAEQHRLTQLYTPPEFVKAANHAQLYGGDDDPLPAHVFGSAASRVYPCHTKAATWMSALFFADKVGQLKQADAQLIRGRILQAAGHWQIKPVVEALWEKMAADAASGMTKLADSDFALVWTGDNQQKERHYPLRNAAEVKMASDWFGQYHSQFAFGDKHTIAKKILEKAAAFGAAISNPDLIDRCAGYGYCAAGDAAGAWEKRASMIRTQNPEYAAAATKMAQVIRESVLEARDVGKRVKMAELMDQFDRHTKLDQYYDAGGLERPEDVLFQITEKVASEFVRDHVQTTTGAVYEKMALQSLQIGDVRQWMGDDLADEVGGVMLDTEKLAAIVPTLPRPEAEMFERMARHAGIPVMGREKGASAQGLSMEEMVSLAQEYDQERSLFASAPALT